MSRWASNPSYHKGIREHEIIGQGIIEGSVGSHCQSDMLLVKLTAPLLLSRVHKAPTNTLNVRAEICNTRVRHPEAPRITLTRYEGLMNSAFLMPGFSHPIHQQRTAVPCSGLNLLPILSLFFVPTVQSYRYKPSRLIVPQKYARTSYIYHSAFGQRYTNRVAQSVTTEVVPCLLM